MSPSVVQGRPFCGGLEWSKANFGRAGPGPRWDLAWRSANLEKFRLRRSFARGPAPSTPVLEESLDFEARRGKKEGFFHPHFIWSYVVQCWSYVASPTPSKMVQCASKSEMTALVVVQSLVLDDGPVVLVLLAAVLVGRETALLRRLVVQVTSYKLHL
eukprot:COSAG01_NODE_23144_length_827_cov_0.711538_1_plen_158_part_00